MKTPAEISAMWEKDRVDRGLRESWQYKGIWATDADVALGRLAEAAGIHTSTLRATWHDAVAAACKPRRNLINMLTLRGFVESAVSRDCSIRTVATGTLVFDPLSTYPEASDPERVLFIAPAQLQYNSYSTVETYPTANLVGVIGAIPELFRRLAAAAADGYGDVNLISMACDRPSETPMVDRTLKVYVYGPVVEFELSPSRGSLRLSARVAPSFD